MGRTVARLETGTCAVVVLCAWASAARVEAHPAIGAPSAYPTVPSTVGIVASSTFSITWLDYNRPIPTGTATIDWYYVHQNPKTYLIGVTPDDLEGELIVGGIAESDLANEYTWDLSSVPSGSYFIWSKVTEPPEEIVTLQLYSFSQGVLTVHHPGDPVHPAVCFNKPDNPFTLVDEQLDMVLDVFDPDGTGLLTLEIFPRDTPEDLTTVFVDRPTSEQRIEEPLDTSMLEEGDYGLRLSIMDARGLGFSAYTRWYFRVTHRLDPIDGGTPDAPDAAPALDAGVVAEAGVPDAGKVAPEDDGCRCVGGPGVGVSPGDRLMWLVLLALGPILRGRRQVSDARRRRLG